MYGMGNDLPPSVLVVVVLDLGFLGLNGLSIQFLYPLSRSTLCTYLISDVRSSSLLTILSALPTSDLTTERLCCRWWLESKARYWSVWVGFLYTLVRILPSSSTTTNVSRKASCLGELYVGVLAVDMIRELRDIVFFNHHEGVVHVSDP